MCYFWENSIDPLFEDWPSLDDYTQMFEQLKTWADKDFKVSFGGGEPLLYANKLFDIAGICKKMCFKTYFPTNAFLLDQNMADKICRAGIDSVGISLDSLDEETHDYIRGKQGSWKKAVNAIDYLKQSCPGISINILTVIMGKNIEHIIDLTQWVSENPRIQSIVFQAVQSPFNRETLSNWYNSEEYAELWVNDHAQSDRVIDELIKIKQDSKFYHKISNSVEQLKMFKDYFKSPAKQYTAGQCHLDQAVLRLCPNGDVYLCGQMDIIGNIKDRSIKQIWYSDKADQVREKIANCRENCHNRINCFQEEKEDDQYGKQRSASTI
jgi:MoaA/NifB/PqqE/SkfB family radical SAM enzyme